VPAPVSFARWLVLGNGTMLHIVAGRTTPATPAKWDHFAIACADMTAMIASLEAKGIKWTDIDGKPKPQIRADGVQQIFIQDPDGYWIEINDALKPK
jgi:lactoylglutathione lyase